MSKECPGCNRETHVYVSNFIPEGKKYEIVIRFDVCINPDCVLYNQLRDKEVWVREPYHSNG